MEISNKNAGKYIPAERRPYQVGVAPAGVAARPLAALDWAQLPSAGKPRRPVRSIVFISTIEYLLSRFYPYYLQRKHDYGRKENYHHQHILYFWWGGGLAAPVGTTSL